VLTPVATPRKLRGNRCAATSEVLETMPTRSPALINAIPVGPKRLIAFRKTCRGRSNAASSRR
jgi:hypothetical protein